MSALSKIIAARTLLVQVEALLSQQSYDPEDVQIRLARIRDLLRDAGGEVGGSDPRTRNPT